VIRTSLVIVSPEKTDRTNSKLMNVVDTVVAGELAELAHLLHGERPPVGGLYMAIGGLARRLSRRNGTAIGAFGP
jgi:hypothetical protein